MWSTSWLCHLLAVWCWMNQIISEWVLYFKNLISGGINISTHFTGVMRINERMNEVDFHHLLFVWLTHKFEGPTLGAGDGEVALCAQLFQPWHWCEGTSPWLWRFPSGCREWSTCKAGVFVFSKDTPSHPQGTTQIFSLVSVLGQPLRVAVLALAANFPERAK